MKKYAVRAGDTLSALADAEYGDGELYTVIAAANDLADPDLITVGQELLIPYVTRRHRFAGPDSSAARAEITHRYYSEPADTIIWEVANHVAQRAIDPGAWLLIPDIADVPGHTVVENESLQILAERWYGDRSLAVIIERANRLPSSDVTPGQVIIAPRFNRRVQVGGQTVRGVCTSQYGDAWLHRWVPIVIAANRITDPDAIVSGQTLLMPS
ncbi:LysM peptidoglycan-binding domain-containing protein [Gordonia amarae]|uniref:LysM peptidoglycan-binding domain-containing protein n=2 Tax=Gordonia amarae TaxID=36821 RepID=A0A857L380_9ACTN|nr:LysM peptidoglycan-binding domain-containing protein [Gordonia amarae]MCS3880926.1 nucleoid-associated protein YgaU [Gordonia amarae]QHN19178.1 LysM peptidoglycan-binding domain-containing protein [Gordonia amarae]QHN23654.1 LysM peptidoglycan-binding domain-containing protein [Gordonia amarae]QHN32565.1 LysM peptidoglycan-binding domain-containing protein [Gordonia amarae]QHN41314.1 LysM peptidoglycan-binding domain-containing protein [Gordonia amarae]